LTEVDEIAVAIQAQRDLRTQLQAELDSFYKQHPTTPSSQSALRFYRICLTKTVGELASLQADIEQYRQTVIPALQRELSLLDKKRRQVQTHISELSDVVELKFENPQEASDVLAESTEALESEITRCDERIAAAKEKIAALRAENRRLDEVARAKRTSMAQKLWADEVKMESHMIVGPTAKRHQTEPLMRGPLRRYSTCDIPKVRRPS
jgi:chromosome segregation ATPase